MSVAEVAEKLELPNLKGFKWNIQGTCALTGVGLYEGMNWISKNVEKKK